MILIRDNKTILKYIYNIISWAIIHMYKYIPMDAIPYYLNSEYSENLNNFYNVNVTYLFIYLFIYIFICLYIYYIILYYIDTNSWGLKVPGRAFQANIPTSKTQTLNILGVKGIWKHWKFSNAIRCSKLTDFLLLLRRLMAI